LLCKPSICFLLFLWSFCFPDITRPFLIVRKAALEYELLVSFPTTFNTVFLIGFRSQLLNPNPASLASYCYKRFIWPDYILLILKSPILMLFTLF
jgi:hypothetical protein